MISLVDSCSTRCDEMSSVRLAKDREYLKNYHHFSGMLMYFIINPYVMFYCKNLSWYTSFFMSVSTFSYRHGVFFSHHPSSTDIVNRKPLRCGLLFLSFSMVPTYICISSFRELLVVFHLKRIVEQIFPYREKIV